MIEIYDNFLDTQTFKEIQEEAKAHPYTLIPHGDDVAYKLDTGNIYKTTKKYWSDEPKAFHKFFDAMHKLDIPSDVFSLMVHVYEPGAEISWHRDYSSIASYSYYIHDEWRSEWGGQLMTTDATDQQGDNGNVFEHRQDVMTPGIGQYYEPVPNRLVLIKGGLHKVNRVQHRRMSFTGFFK
jgi:Rps23 Pro-64 3,4-dihydroxylase Tpa1-like proline 4-hydroxylase